MKANRIITFAICFIMLFSNTYAAPQIDINNGEVMYDFFEDVLKATEKTYRFDVTRDELITAAIKKMITDDPKTFDTLMKGAYSALEEHSRYLSEDEFAKATEDIGGQFVGIGVNISENNGKTVVSAPITGSPAHLAGLKTGDIIETVDGVDITGFVIDKTVSLIRGEIGTTVKIIANRLGEKINFNIVRNTIKISPVEYNVLDKNNSAYVRISSFNANTNEYLTAALDELSKKGIDKIILDLRYNPGGLLVEAVNVASHFLPDDTLVVTEDYKNDARDIGFYSQHTNKKFKVVVLVNEYSASASEIVAGAIKDHKLGTLVGKTTYGKGTVQQPTRLKNGGAMWITVAKYNTPSGVNIDKIGIDPDVSVKNTKEKADLSKFEPVDASRKLTLGDEGKDVLAIKQRLNIMGYYFNSVDEKYDDRTVDIIRDFQEKNGLFPYGVADLTTQLKIIEISNNSEVEVDKQIERAKEIIFKM